MVGLECTQVFVDELARRNGDVEWDMSCAVITKISEEGFDTRDQEMIISKQRNPRRCVIDCTFNTEITKLRKNPSFKVHHLVLNRTGLIIGVTGELSNPDFVTVRTVSRKKEVAS